MTGLLNWRSLKDEKPEDGEHCLTIMKHGIISGMYDAKNNDFSDYYWRDMSWYASHWVPTSELGCDYYDMYYDSWKK